MTRTSFSRPVGAPFDVAELEYIAALHQSCIPRNRQNGTVSSIDIVRFFRSRFGFIVPHEHALRVVRELGGNRLNDDLVKEILKQQEEQAKAKQKDEENKSVKIIGLRSSLMQRKIEEEKTSEDKKKKEEEIANALLAEDEFVDLDEPEEYLDIVQLLSIVLIPTLARAALEYHDPPEPLVDRFETEEPPGSMWKRFWWRRQIYKEQAQEAEFQSLRPQPERLLTDVLKFLLQSINIDTDKDGYPELNADLVVKLLEAHGESERAQDPDLVAEMVAACNAQLLDPEAWIMALTGDVQQWEVGCEDRTSTHIYDVWGYDSYPDYDRIQHEQQEEEKENGEKEAPDPNSKSPLDDNVDRRNYVIERKRIQSNIDLVIDNHSSVALVAAIWMFYISTALLYTSMLQTLPGLQSTCSPSFGCTLLGTIYVWMLFAAILIFMGFIVVLPLSMANNPAERSPLRNFLVAVLTGIYCWGPFAIVEWYETERVEPSYDGTEKLVRDHHFHLSQVVAQFCGVLLILFAIREFVLAVIGNNRIQKSEFLTNYFSSSNTFGVTNAKKAATRKINKMMQNAHMLHTEGGSDNTMLNFVLHGERREAVASVLWTWKMLLTRRLFNSEGVWVATRIVVVQHSMVLIILAVNLAGLSLIDAAAQRADETNKSLEEDYDNLPQWVYDVVPSSGQVRGALYPALVMADVVMILLFVLYLPSYVATTLKYRSGELPSLKSHYFIKYRNVVDTVYFNIGNSIYGLVGSAFLFFAIFGLVIFLFIWPFSQEFMVILLAWGIGLTITIVIKMMATKTCRKKFFSSYYRTKPGAANLSSLALECWCLGLGGGVLIGRLTQFLLAAAFWVGRVDVPFLSEDVNMAGYTFDYVPTNFVKDILVHDAHRHPYLERLITMYMMKLKDNAFGSEAGSCWRQLFVVALMPWIMKQRVFTEERVREKLQVYAQRLQMQQKMARLQDRDFLEKLTDLGSDARKTLVDEMTESRPGKYDGMYQQV